MEFTSYQLEGIDMGTQGFAVAPDGTVFTYEQFFAPTYAYDQQPGIARAGEGK